MGCFLNICDQAAIVRCFTLSWQSMNTQRKKVGSLLSSCWQLKNTMPIHSLGIKALSGLHQTLVVGFGRGDSLPLHSITVGRRDCFYRAALFIDHNTSRKTDDDKHNI